MPEATPNPELLKSLGRLVRGLSALFWGLPTALIVCFHTARFDALRHLGPFPAIACTAWLFYGLWQLGTFQKQERVWRNALDSSRLLALSLLGLSPFLFWWSRMPDNLFFTVMLGLEALVGILFLASLNVVLQRLGAMLPDEALRQEIRQFTSLNLNLLAGMLIFALGMLALLRVPWRLLPDWAFWLRMLLERGTVYILVPLLLLPLAMTMALLWKTKEVILESVFTSSH